MYKSKKILPKKVLSLILNIVKNNGGNVTYVFRSERYNIKKEEKYFNTAHLSSKISSESLIQENGSKKTPYQIWEMLEKTRLDFGASYFLIS